MSQEPRIDAGTASEPSFYPQMTIEDARRLVIDGAAELERAIAAEPRQNFTYDQSQLAILLVLRDLLQRQ